MRKVLTIIREHAGFLASTILLFLAAGAAFILLRESRVTDASAEVLAALHGTFNLVEGFVWLAAGALVLLRRASSPASVRAPLLLAGLAFLAFGPSDFVEIRTGAWYEPWWLFAWKAVCVLALLGSYRWYAVRKREAVPRARDPES